MPEQGRRNPSQAEALDFRPHCHRYWQLIFIYNYHYVSIFDSGYEKNNKLLGTKAWG